MKAYKRQMELARSALPVNMHGIREQRRATIVKQGKLQVQALLLATFVELESSPPQALLNVPNVALVTKKQKKMFVHHVKKENTTTWSTQQRALLVSLANMLRLRDRKNVRNVVRGLFSQQQSSRHVKHATQVKSKMKRARRFATHAAQARTLTLRALRV